MITEENINQTIAELKEKLQKLDAKKNFFKEVYSEEKYNELLEELNNIESEIARLEQSKKSMSKYSDQYEYEKIMLMTDEELEEGLDAKKEEVLKDIKEENEKIKKELEEKTKELEDIPNQIKSLEQQIEEIGDKFTEVSSEEEQHSLIEEGKSLQNKIKELIAKQEELKAQIEELENSIKEENVDSISISDYRKELISNLEKYYEGTVIKPDGLDQLIYECLSNGMTVEEFVSKFNATAEGINNTPLERDLRFKDKYNNQKNYFAEIRADEKGKTSITEIRYYYRDYDLPGLLSYLTDNYNLKNATFKYNTTITDVLRILKEGNSNHYNSEESFEGLLKEKEALEETLSKINENRKEWNRQNNLSQLIKESKKKGNFKEQIEILETEYSDEIENGKAIRDFYEDLKEIEAINEKINNKQQEIKELEENKSFFGKKQREQKIASNKSRVKQLEKEKEEKIDSLRNNIGFDDDLRSLVLADKFNDYYRYKWYCELAGSDLYELENSIKLRLNKINKDLDNISKIEETIIKQDLETMKKIVKQFIGDKELSDNEIEEIYYSIARKAKDNGLDVDSVKKSYERSVEEKYITSERERAKKDYESKKKEISAKNLVEENKEETITPSGAQK